MANCEVFSNWAPLPKEYALNCRPVPTVLPS